MSEIHCPECRSENVQKLSLAVLSGAALSKGNSSVLSEIHAPPAKKGTGWASFFFVFSVIIALMFQASFFIITALVAFGFLIHAVFYNEREYPPLLEEWQKQWICQRCAKVFTITD